MTLSHVGSAIVILILLIPWLIVVILFVADAFISTLKRTKSRNAQDAEKELKKISVDL